MSSQKKCIACSKHCPAPPRFQLPASPCPELLATNSVPSDVQINEIHSFIRSAEAEISALKDHMVQVQRTLDRLESQHAELVGLVQSHRGVVSTLRRLPTDILGEIFSQYLGASSWRTYSPKALSHLVGVCARWRAIALASPLLWRHIRPIATYDDPGDLQQISLQLQRSAPVALSICLDHWDTGTSSRAMDLLLTESRRWQSLHLVLYSAAYEEDIAAWKVEFPVLEKLTLVICDSELPKDIALFVESLRVPALEDLTLDTNQSSIPGTLDIIWAQLRICTLTDCCTADILHVLPLFSAGTRVCLKKCFDGEEQLPVTLVHTAVSDLSLHGHCDMLLSALTAPRLERFHVVGDFSVPHIIAFFNRSLCALTHLGVTWNAFSNRNADLLTLLRSPHASNIVDLDITNLPSALARDSDVVPNLRTLALRRFGWSHAAVASVLEMRANRRPIFQSLWLNLFPVSDFSQDTLQALKAGGLEVVIFEGSRAM